MLNARRKRDIPPLKVLRMTPEFDALPNVPSGPVSRPGGHNYVVFGGNNKGIVLMQQMSFLSPVLKSIRYG